jgi:tetratricopeptide (TPR) repeat protein
MIVLCLLMQVLAAVDPPARIDAGDEFFGRIDYPSAVAAYEDVLREQNANPDVLWRLARAYVCMGEVAEAQRREELFRTAELYARRCIAADSTCSEGHSWLAGSLGYLAYYGGKGEQIRLSHEVLREANRAIELNGNNDAAYSIKGSLYRALANVGWVQKELAAILYGRVPTGSFDEAEAALKRAIELAPDVMRHHYELGVVYLDWGKKDEARAVLRHAATLPVRVAIDRPRLEKIKALLAQIED